MAVFDTMRHIRPDVSTVCVGLAASMGAFLLASGHKVPSHSCRAQQRKGQLLLVITFIAISVIFILPPYRKRSL